MNISELSLREKIGQMFIVGVMDDEHLQKVLLEYHVGGIIHFSRNGQTAKEGYNFFSRAKELSKYPLFTTIDQEGGIVTRIKEGVTPISGNMAISATGQVENAEITSDILARELTLLGANMNLAPVVDVNNNPQNPVINVRSYGENPDLVSGFSSASLRGYKNRDMLAVAKHFPGHGDTSLDSHFDLPVVEHGLERLHKVELKPFKQMIEDKIEGIMISHVMFKAIDEKRPATLSKEVVTGLLRDELGYDGLIMTDCMEMHAVAKTFIPENAVVEAILAGVDMVMYSSNREMQVACLESVYLAVREGIISEDIIDRAVTRIWNYKKNITNKIQSWKVVKQKLRKENDINNAISIAISSITLKGIMPFDISKCFNYVIPDSDLLKKEFPQAVGYDDLNFNEETVVFYRRKSDLQPYINRLDSGKVVLVALKSPYEFFEGYATLFTYELTNLSVVALQAVLEGDKANGKLPVSEVV